MGPDEALPLLLPACVLLAVLLAAVLHDGHFHRRRK